MAREQCLQLESDGKRRDDALVGGDDDREVPDRSMHAQILEFFECKTIETVKGRKSTCRSNLVEMPMSA